MFDAIGQSAKAETGQAMPHKADIMPRKEATETQKPSQQEKVKKNEQNLQISQAVLDELKNDFGMIHNVGFQFSLHQATNRTIVRVINEETQELIREIPTEEMLNIMAKMDEMMGVLFDKKA
jgi:flagellar protein FlaG